MKPVPTSPAPKPLGIIAPEKPATPQPTPVSALPNPLVAVLIVVGSFLLAMIGAQVVIGILISFRHLDVQRDAHLINVWLNSVGMQFFYTVLAYSLLVLPIIFFLRWRGISVKVIGLKRPRWSDPLWGLLALPIYFISYGLLLIIVSHLVPSLNLSQKQQIGFATAAGPDQLILTFISLAVIPPIAEEFVMRGFLFTSLSAKLKMSVAVVITSLLFAAGHLQFGSGAPLLWVAAIDTFVLSLFLIFLRIKTDSLWASITLHALKNSIAFIAIFILHKG